VKGTRALTCEIFLFNFVRQQNYTWEWLPGNDCKIISPTLPAVRPCSNGNKSFFNQVIAAYTGWVDKRNEQGKGVVLADGSLLDKAVMRDLVAFVEKERVVFPWHPGNFVMIDNSVAAHSRQPFDPRSQRKVLASIANGRKDVGSGVGTPVEFALSSGDRMPAVGLGLWKVPKDTCAECVYAAVKMGYRCLDSACDYGNEAETGQGLLRAMSDGLVARHELFVASKLWNTYHRREHVRLACLRTLRDLQVEYLDMYYVHFPIALKFVDFETRYPPEWLHDPSALKPRMVPDDVPLHETWAAMEELVREGLVRNIGLCNVQSAMLSDVLSYAKIKPAALQVELHPYLTQEKLHRLCRQHGIALIGFSSFGSASYVELGMAEKNESLLDDKRIKQLAAKYSRSPAQVVLRWAVQRGTGVIPKSQKASRMKENLSIFDFQLSDEDLNAISLLNKNKRYNDPGNFCEAAFNTFHPIYD
jgi:D-xylose reductase